MIRREWSIGLAMMAALACGCGDDDGEPATKPDETDATVENVRTSDAAADARVSAGDARVSLVADASVDAALGRDARADAEIRAADDASVRDAAVRDAGMTVQTASWLIKPGDSVFFIGNSFFMAYDRVLPEWVTAVGQAVTPKFDIETDSYIVPGNMPLQWFFEQDESQSAIESDHYDMFILQGEDTEPVDHKDDFQDAVRAYHKAITAKGRKVMLFMTWDFKQDSGPDSDFYQKLAAAYDEIGRELNIPVIPVGQIYNDCNKDVFPGQKPYFLTTNGNDKLHESVMGSAVNAYATFSMLTGINPMGVQFDARANTNTADFLVYASTKSWARVSERLR